MNPRPHRSDVRRDLLRTIAEMRPAEEAPGNTPGEFMGYPAPPSPDQMNLEPGEARPPKAGEGMSGFVPVLGDVQGATEAADAFGRGDYDEAALGAGLTAIGALPLVPNIRARQVLDIMVPSGGEARVLVNPSAADLNAMQGPVRATVGSDGRLYVWQGNATADDVANALPQGVAQAGTYEAPSPMHLKRMLADAYPSRSRGGVPDRRIEGYGF